MGGHTASSSMCLRLLFAFHFVFAELPCQAQIEYAVYAGYGWGGTDRRYSNEAARRAYHIRTERAYGGLYY